MKNLSTFAIILMSSMLIYSCVTSETQTLETSDILGKWTLKSATRGGTATQTLENIYFDFKEEGQVATNFNLETKDQQLTYELKEGNILVRGENNLDIEPSKDLDGNLTFKTMFKKYKFVLILEPAKEKETKDAVGGNNESGNKDH